jgi:hypothetical protein
VITVKEAQQALEALKGQFRPYLEAGCAPPEIVWEGGRLDSEPLLSWEQGPWSWAHAARTGGTDEELSAAFERTVKVPAAVGWPKGVVCVPVGGWKVRLRRVR